MKLGSTDYAALDQLAYTRQKVGSVIVLNGKRYTPIAHADAPHSGFQATAYDHAKTDGSHEVVVAYRGTENGGARKLDGIRDDLVDAGMVLAGLNAQAPDAMAFTRRVMQEATERAREKDYAVCFTVTGHSLGGTLAQIMAYEYGLRGETFNAYGAAGLMPGIPEGGHQVINHVRATDVVSAANRHFGEVRVYATEQDIDALAQAGYTDIPLLNMLPSTHAPVLGQIQADAHGIANFVADAANGGQSLLSPAYEANYQAHAVMVSAYRNDIGNARATTTFLAKATAEPAMNMLALGLGEAGRAARGVKHGLRDLEHQGEALAHGLASRFEAFSTRLDRMLAAADAGDWASFRRDTHAMALSDHGQALRTQAVATVDQQERYAAAQAWQPQAQQQPAPVAVR